MNAQARKRMAAIVAVHRDGSANTTDTTSADPSDAVFESILQQVILHLSYAYQHRDVAEFIVHRQAMRFLILCDFVGIGLGWFGLD